MSGLDQQLRRIARESRPTVLYELTTLFAPEI
jgi:hypothetical protein